MRLHHPYLNGGGDGIGKNHMDKCQQADISDADIAMYLSKLKNLCV